jgi:hypothetical protein
MKNTHSIKNRFPKKIPKLSVKKKKISNSFMKLWHQKLKKITLIENFNHNYVAKSNIVLKKNIKTLGNRSWYWKSPAL